MYTNECLYKDVYTIIEMMDDNMRNKINNNFIEFLKENQDVNFEGTINKDIPIKEQKLKTEIKLMLSQMYIDYFCEPEKREEILRLEKQNIDNFYNRDIFEKKGNITNQEEIKCLNINTGVDMIEYKENIFNKIINIIKGFFKRK